uniref:Transmembrane protein 132C n=1 Tax=Pseudonaja textilis TaxID=8673 RepID=A0A670ZV61_PSETE
QMLKNTGLKSTLAMGRVVFDGVQKFSSLSAYLPVKYQISGTESSFFLREANHEFIKNSSLQSRVETFFTYKTKKRPVVSVSYGPFLVEHDVPQDLLLTPNAFGSTNKFTFNWKLKTYIMSEKIYLTRPKVQILFYIVGRDWDDYSMSEQLPCMHVFAFWETLGVRGSCRLKGDLGLCVASLDLQPTWFNPPTVVTGRKKVVDRSDGILVELYYAIHPGGENGECSTEDLRKGNAIRPGKEGAGERMSHLQRIGSISLHQAPETSQLTELWLDSDIVIQLPLKPVKQGEVVTASVTVTNNITVDQFILRAKVKKGVNILNAKISELRQWDVMQEVSNGGKHSTIAVMCHRIKANSRSSEVVRLNFEIASFSSLSGTQPISWQVEYPQKKMTEMALSEIFICQKDLVGIVPLAMDTDILNTAILTGKTVAVPIKVISVEENNVVMDISESVECKSSAEDVVKVKSLLVFIVSILIILTRDSDDEDVDDHKGRGCTLQYQHAMVRVLTQFVAEDASPSGQLSYLLGSDWQIDITDLVTDFMKLEKPYVAELQGGKVLVGQEVGMTMVQVLSPLSDSILAEKTVTVLDDKVTITDMGVQLVAGLSLVLQPSIASPQAFVATTIAQDLLHTPKQEAMVSSWIQFSDGAVTPLDIYDPRDFSLSASSLDELVVSAHQSSTVKWPVVVAEGEGEGLLVKVDMMISESCQKSKRKSILAVGNGNIKVKFGQNDANPHGLGDYSAEEIENHASDRRQKVFDQEGQYYRSSSDEREEGPGRKTSVTAKSTTKNKVFKSIPEGDKLSDEGLLQNIPIDFTNFPAQIDLPQSNNGMEDSDLVETPRALSDLETGMYALLGVFCLAILVFLINCATFTLKYRHKQLPMEREASMNHSHDWVWLGNEMELLDNPADVSPPPDECTTIIDQGVGFDAGSQLLVGTPKKLPSQSSPKIQLRDKQIRDLKQEHPLHSPTSKRKRVKFTTFTTIPPDDGCPTVNSILNCNEDDIKWVCQDMDLGESKQIRNYLEKLKDKM